MSNSCPLSFKKVDSNVSRFSSLFVATLVISYLFTQNIFILFFLAFDFSMKLFVSAKASPLTLLSELLKKSFKMQEKLSDGGAKRLAAFLGLFFVLLLIVTTYLAPWAVTVVLAVIFLLCSLLDIFLNYCIGCNIYFIIKKIYPNFMNKL
jgi:hypothetical protein